PGRGEHRRNCEPDDRERPHRAPIVESRAAMAWAIDLGNTNTSVAQWDPVEGRPKLLELPDICRKKEATDPLEAPRLVPSATLVLENLDWKSRLGARPFFARRFFM